MLHTNIPIIFSKKEIPTIRKEVEKNIKYGLQELKQYINTKEKIDIKYDIQEVQKGYICTGDLYFGNNLIKHYDYIDELFLDLYHMELEILLENRNKSQRDDVIEDSIDNENMEDEL